MVLKSRKIRIYPTSNQKAILKKWFGDSRYFFNQTIDYLEKNTDYPNYMKVFPVVRDNVPDWHKQTPFQIKKIACKDACSSIKKVRQNRKAKIESKPTFRSRHNYIQSIFITKSAVTSEGIYHTILGKLKSKEEIPIPIHDCRLENFYGDFYIIIPIQEEAIQSENQARVVGIDSGVRNFIGYFSEDSCGLLGENANLIIYKLCLKLDKLKSKISKAKCRQKKRLRKAFIRLSGKIKYLVDELHKKTAKFITDNFDIILLPTFEVSNMVFKSIKRKLCNKSVRQMLSLSHYKFKQYLKFKAMSLGKLVIDVCEAYTSKTVSWTGEIVENLGGAKVIKSKQTNEKMLRDINAPRNIFIKSLVDTPILTNFVKLNIC